MRFASSSFLLLFRFTAFLFVLLAVTTCSFAQFSQQGSKLCGTGGTGGYPEQGSGVALSSDGSTAIVGGWDDNSGVGALWVFTRSGGVWSQQGSKLVGSGYTGSLVPNEGYSVALSGDGNTAIIGGNFDNMRVGAAWVFTRSGGVWSQQGSKLTANDCGCTPPWNSFQGFSVGISADGNTAIVGGEYDNNRVGAAWIYTRSGGVWSQQGHKLVGSDESGTSYQGNAVAMSGDGSTAAVGGLNDSPVYGSVWIYARTDSTWKQQHGKILPNDFSGTPAFGNSVALSYDGNTLAVGGGNDNTGVGAIWVFTRSPIDSTWRQQGHKLVPSDHSIISQVQTGISVSISADGNTLIAGGYMNDSSAGAAWVFTRTDTVWTQQGSKLFGSDTVGRGEQGISVAMSGDGNTALVGGLADSTYSGAAWVYATPEAPLAVELASFSAAAAKSDVTVQWSTASETNNYGFYVERLGSSASSWSTVSRLVPGAGTSLQLHHYSFVDQSVSSGTYYYRIRQVDLDGRAAHSQQIKVVVSGVLGVHEGSAPLTFALLQNYPNPFNPSTIFDFQLPIESPVTLKVYNVLGMEVATLVHEVKQPGSYSVAWDATGMPSGFYFYKLVTPTRTDAKKMLLLK